MARKLSLTNLALALAIFGLGMQLIGSWQEFDRQQEIRRMAARSPTLPHTAATLDLDQQSSSLDYFLIAERNLFAEDRQAPGKEIDSSTETAPWPSPALILHGTLIIGERREATVTKLQGSGRLRTHGSRVRVARGDVVQGYTVSEITEDTLVLKWNDRKVVIEKEQGGSLQAPDGSKAAAGGINIIRIGTPVAAVEATTLRNPAEQQKVVLTVSKSGPS